MTDKIVRDPRTGVRETEAARLRRLRAFSFEVPRTRRICYWIRQAVHDERIDTFIEFHGDAEARRYGMQNRTVMTIRRTGKNGTVVYRGSMPPEELTT